MADELSFESLEPIEVPVKFGGETYTLREASEATATAFRGQMMQGAKMTDGKVTTTLGTAMLDAQTFLVSQCLRDPAGELIPVVKIKQWPARIVKALFTKAQEISDLKEEDDEDKAKNELSGITDG